MLQIQIQLGQTTLTLSPAPRGNWLVRQNYDGMLTDAGAEFTTLGAALSQLSRTTLYRESLGAVPVLTWYQEGE